MNQQYIATMTQNLNLASEALLLPPNTTNTSEPSGSSASFTSSVNCSDEQIMEQYNHALIVPVEEDDQSTPVYDIYDIIDGADIECGIQEEKEDTEENAYGLEGEYKTDFEAWKHNYSWFGKSFQEWIQEKQEYERELIREMAESWEDYMSDDGGRYDYY